MQNNMVRMDRYLQHCQLCSSRKQAKEMLDDRLVFINQKFAKPSSEVKNDDIIILNFPEEQKIIKARVEPKQDAIYVGYDLIDVKRKEIFLC